MLGFERVVCCVRRGFIYNGSSCCYGNGGNLGHTVYWLNRWRMRNIEA